MFLPFLALWRLHHDFQFHLFSRLSNNISSTTPPPNTPYPTQFDQLTIIVTYLLPSRPQQSTTLGPSPAPPSRNVPYKRKDAANSPSLPFPRPHQTSHPTQTNPCDHPFHCPTHSLH